MLLAVATMHTSNMRITSHQQHAAQALEVFQWMAVPFLLPATRVCSQTAETHSVLACHAYHGGIITVTAQLCSASLAHDE